MSTVEMLNLILIVILVFIVLLGLVAVLLIFKMRTKNNGSNKDEKIKVNSKEERQNLITARTGKPLDSIYKFMEFDEITDNMIVRKNRKQYIMAIECKGINYDLLSEEEKNAVESGFIEFLNTLRFPIQLYVQTRTLNLNDILNQYEKRIENINEQIIKINSQIEMARARGNNDTVDRLLFDRQRMENILEYGVSIEDYTKNISESKSILQQKTYVILSYFIDEYGNVSNYSKEELNDIAFTELYTRAQSAIRALASAEITGKVLNSEELAELLYVAYNRDSSEKYSLKNALDSQYDRLYSTARDVLEEKKQRIERQIKEEASNLAARSIIKADEVIRQERQKKVKEEAMKMVDEYKGELSNKMYQEAKRQVINANVEEASVESKPEIYRKNV